MRQESISQEQAEFFNQNGYLIVRQALDRAELEAMQAAMERLVAFADKTRPNDPDYMFRAGHRTGASVLQRIEYVIDKDDTAKALLANPFILRSVETLQGPDLIPTWDSMVLKAPGEGIIVPWHRDAGTGGVGDRPIFNVDFYLDRADEENCVWVIPGSQAWPTPEVEAWLGEHRDREQSVEEFKSSRAVPAVMEPGDVLFHNILVLHGSPATTVNRWRRVVYYEFRPAHVELERGPHVPEYIPLKQKLLLACMRLRCDAAWLPKDERAFQYLPPAPFNTTELAPNETLDTYRYAHGDYWR
ncbi:MAG: phytanoyl-CoA dioxygenase family protein [Armatimonadetes bacterium]|nr:phytanoyl-CoA dioxygenase family protein [Armatimonadota bacterium]MDE2206913.1 phytanoyl-CoA dioxygenase family protein [Armatimonadota bacterium]